MAAVAAVICALYWIKPRRFRLAVASTLVWRRVLRETRVHDRRRRWLLSLLLALAIGLSLALAVTRPHLQALGGSLQRIVVILDNSASMGARTRDGRTRWEHALDGARRVIESTGAGSEVLVLDTAGRAQLAGFVASKQALEQLSRISVSPEAVARVPPLPVGDTITRAYLFTDGVGVSGVPGGIAVRPVFETADNVAITGFEARPVPGHPTRYEAFLQITNASSVAKPVALEVIGAEGFRAERQLQVGAADTVNLTLDVSRFEQGPLRARIAAPGDAFDLDDTAYCMVLPHRTRRVLLITPGNETLEDSLSVLPGVALTVRTPAEFTAQTAYDAYVFDRFAPPEAPATGALLFRPPAVAWIGAKWRSVSGAAAARWDDSHPLAGAVTWRDLRLESAQAAQPQGAAAVVAVKGAHGVDGALVLAGRARARWVAVGFALEESNFPLQPGFPVFLGTALDWLTEGLATTSEDLGPIEVPIGNAQVLEGGERRVAATATPRGTLFEATRPGVYVASNGEQQLVVVANAIDARIAQINRQQVRAAHSDAHASDRPRGSWPEPWIWLLALAFVLLTVESATFARRITE
jgi:hypothetical protein